MANNPLILSSNGLPGEDQAIAVSLNGFARVNGAELYYEATGEGLPVVLIHGSWVDHRMWVDQVQALADHHMVLRYDVRGYGRSSMPSIQYSHHEDLDGLLNHLKIGRAHLVGLSMGGAIAVNAAICLSRTGAVPDDHSW